MGISRLTRGQRQLGEGAEGSVSSLGHRGPVPGKQPSGPLRSLAGWEQPLGGGEPGPINTALDPTAQGWPTGQVSPL